MNVNVELWGSSSLIENFLICLLVEQILEDIQFIFDFSGIQEIEELEENEGVEDDRKVTRRSIFFCFFWIIPVFTIISSQSTTPHVKPTWAVVARFT